VVAKNLECAGKDKDIKEIDEDDMILDIGPKTISSIKTIITQIERLARSCFSLEFDCKKLGSTNINTPIK